MTVDVSDNESVSSDGSGAADPKLGSFEEWQSAIVHYAGTNFHVDEKDLNINQFSKEMHDKFLKDAKKLRKILRKTEDEHKCDPVISVSVHLVCNAIADKLCLKDGSAWETNEEVAPVYEKGFLPKYKMSFVVAETDDEKEVIQKQVSHTDVYRYFRKLKLQKQHTLMQLVEDRIQKLYASKGWHLPCEKAYYNLTNRDIVFYRYPTVLKDGRKLSEVLSTIFQEATVDLFSSQKKDVFSANKDEDEVHEHRSRERTRKKKSKKKRRRLAYLSDTSSSVSGTSDDDSRSPSPKHHKKRKKHKHSAHKKKPKKPVRPPSSSSESESEDEKAGSSEKEKDLFSMLTESENKGEGNRIYWAALIEEEGYDAKLRDLWESTNQRHLDEWGTGSDNDPLVKFKMKCGGEFHRRRRSRKGVKYDWSVEESRTTPFTVLTQEYREEMIDCIKVTFRRLRN
jgi:hypothetical protein